jgi:hypothetical protein
MAEMHAIEYPNREKQWATQFRQLGDGPERLHQENDE